MNNKQFTKYNWRLQTARPTERQFKTLDIRFQVSVVRAGRLQTGNCKLETANWKLETASWRLETANWKLQTGDCKLPARLNDSSKHWI